MRDNCLLQRVDPLRQWGEWRTQINEGLSQDLTDNTYRHIPVGDDFHKLVQPPQRNRHGVYRYSTAPDQATLLHKEDYINFGMLQHHFIPPS